MTFYLHLWIYSVFAAFFDIFFPLSFAPIAFSFVLWFKFIVKLLVKRSILSSAWHMWLLCSFLLLWRFTFSIVILFIYKNLVRNRSVSNIFTCFNLFIVKQPSPSSISSTQIINSTLEIFLKSLSFLFACFFLVFIYTETPNK